MANKIDDVIAAVNEGTNAVAARIERLVARLGDSVTPEQLAEFQAISDHLKTLGQDPENPVPTPPG